MFARPLRFALPLAVGLAIAAAGLPASAGGPSYSLSATPTSGVPGAAIVLTATPTFGSCNVSGYTITATYVGGTGTKSFTGTFPSPVNGAVTINVIVPTDASPGTTLTPGQVTYGGQLACSPNGAPAFTAIASVRVLAPAPSPTPTPSSSASPTPSPTKSATPATPVKRPANFTG